MDIYQRIKKAREAKGWSMQELAEKVGYSSRSAIARVESGERSVNHEMIKKYAEALEISPLKLLYGEGEELDVHVDILVDEFLKLNHENRVNSNAFEREYNANLENDLEADFSFTATKEQDNNRDILEGYRLFVKKKDVDKIENGELVLVSIGANTHLVYWYYSADSDNLVLMPCGSAKFGSTIFPPSRRNILNYIGTVVYVARKPHRRDDFTRIDNGNNT